MRYYQAIAILSALMLGGVLTRADAELRPEGWRDGWYIGVTTGRSDFDNATVGDLGRNRAITDEDDNVLGLFGGYDFHDYAGVELAVRDFGQIEGSFLPVGGGAGTSVQAEAFGVDLVGVGRLPIWRRRDHGLSAFTKLGGFFWYSDTENLGAGAAVEDGEGINFTGGGGAAWHFNEQVRIEAEWRHYSDMFDAFDVQTLSVNLVWDL